MNFVMLGEGVVLNLDSVSYFVKYGGYGVEDVNAW